MKKSELIVAFSRSQVGEPYDLGDHGPNRWDCSGLTMEAVELIGLSWPHSSHTQYYNNIRAGGDFNAHGEMATAPAGELLFLFHYGTRTNGGKGMVHVGIRDGLTDTVIQAGGYLGKGVHENPFSKAKKYFSEWCTLEGANDEIPEDEVRLGSTGAAAAVMQVRLNASGANLEIDGKFGSLSETALKAFQAEHGITENGVCGAETWPLLDAIEYPSSATNTAEPSTSESVTVYPTLRRGAGGEDVKTLQTLLNQFGANPQLDVDGKFGPLTETAVRKYQGDNELAIDGIVGPITWGELTAQ